MKRLVFFLGKCVRTANRKKQKALVLLYLASGALPNAANSSHVPTEFAVEHNKDEVLKNSPKTATNCAQITHKIQRQPYVELSKVHFHIHNVILAF